MTLKLCWIICFALAPSLSFAQEWDRTSLPGLKNQLACRKDNPAQCAVIMETGEKAPIGGILQSVTLAAAVAAKADPELIQRRIDLEVRTATSALGNDLGLRIITLEIDKQALKDVLSATEQNHQKQLEAATPHWAARPWFVIPVTVAATLGLIGASVAIACELNDCGPN